MNHFFTSEEKKQLFSLYKQLRRSAGDSISGRDSRQLKKHLTEAVAVSYTHLTLPTICSV